MRLYRNTRKYGVYEDKVHGSRHGRRTLCGRRMGLFFAEVVDVRITCGKCAERATGPRSTKRIQLSRKRGWRKPEGAVVVSRPGRWGNPFSISDISRAYPSLTNEQCAAMSVRDLRDLIDSGKAHTRSVRQDDGTRGLIEYSYPPVSEIRRELAGKDLACWCPLHDDEGNRFPCHADLLLEISAA